MIGEFHSTNGLGEISFLRRYLDWFGWTQVIPGNFGGNGFTDLLFYEASTGIGEFYTTDGSGGISLLKRHTNWFGWTHIIPGNFGGNGFTDLLFYEASTGIGEFYTTDGSGGISLLMRYEGWFGWTHIIPGNFGGNGFTDLLFYEASTGIGEFYTTDGSGGISLLMRHEGWFGWTHIVPGNYGSNGFTDLLFYENVTADRTAEFYTTNGLGGISLLRRYIGGPSSWTHIIPGNFGGNGFTDLLFYEAATGIGEFYATDGLGGLSLLRRYTNWREFWKLIVPGNFGGNRFTDLLFYGSEQQLLTRRLNPELHGFKFENRFANDFIPALDIRTNGLCGGMSYAALDYYFAHLPIPTQRFRPANGTTLHRYIYDRQVTSIVSNLDKWAEIGFNPGGARDTEFFNWGISAKKGERIDELKQFLDKGIPCILGLQGDGSTGQHQVIAFGYDMGRYQGDLGEHIEDFKIFICDPNHPEEIRTLIPDVERKIYRYQEGGSKTWRTYFVDKNYHAQQPPAIANANYPVDNLVYELILKFLTGRDDLRGGNDNIDLEVNLTDGSKQVYRNINLGSRWISNNDESAEIILQRPIRVEQLQSLVITATFGRGFGSDKWDMNSLVIHILGGNLFKDIKSVEFKRFTGEDNTLVVSFP